MQHGAEGRAQFAWHTLGQVQPRSAAEKNKDRALLGVQLSVRVLGSNPQIRN